MLNQRTNGPINAHLRHLVHTQILSSIPLCIALDKGRQHKSYTGKAVSENMFEYYGNIHVYSPGAGADNPRDGGGGGGGLNIFSQTLIFCPFAYYQ